MCNLNHNLSKEIPIGFCNGYKYDCRFIIKELAEEFEKNTCLGENNDKYITFTAPMEKEVTKMIKMATQEMIKMEKKLQKIYLTYYTFL